MLEDDELQALRALNQVDKEVDKEERLAQLEAQLKARMEEAPPEAVPIFAELQAFEPKPDPSHERIAVALEQLVELPPRRQRQAEDALRTQVNQLSDVLQRKQKAINLVFLAIQEGRYSTALDILAPETPVSGASAPVNP